MRERYFSCGLRPRRRSAHAGAEASRSSGKGVGNCTGLKWSPKFQCCGLTMPSPSSSSGSSSCCVLAQPAEDPLPNPSELAALVFAPWLRLAGRPRRISEPASLGAGNVDATWGACSRSNPQRKACKFTTSPISRWRLLSCHEVISRFSLSGPAGGAAGLCGNPTAAGSDPAAPDGVRPAFW